MIIIKYNYINYYTTKMSQNILYYEFYFKVPYTTRTFTIQFHPDTTIEKFKEIVFDKNRTLNPHYQEENLFEIVEAGRFNNVNGRDAELAPAIDYPDEWTLSEVYDSIWKTSAFYIRPIAAHQN